MEPGGFLPHLPSPPNSSIGSPSIDHSALPSTRSHPLKRGSTKESAVIDHVDAKLLEISRRYEKRFNPANQRVTETDTKIPGYETFGEAARDLDSVTDVVWVTGTRMAFVVYKMVAANNALKLRCRYHTFLLSLSPCFRICLLSPFTHGQRFGYCTSLT